MERKQRVNNTSRDVASWEKRSTCQPSSLSPARSLLPRPPRPPLQCKGCAKGSGAVYVPHSPCFGSHRRPLHAPPFTARARWGRAFPPSVRVGSVQTGNTGRRAKVRPPSSPPRPRSLEQDLGVGLPFEPAPDMHGRGRDGQRHNPLPLPSRSCARAKRPHSLYPYPVCARRGCRDGPPRGRGGEGLHAPPCRTPSCHLALPPLCLCAR